MQTVYNNKAYESVSEDYKDLHDKLKHKPEFLFEEAQCLSKTGQHAEAIRVLEPAERRPDDPVHDRQKPADARRLPGGRRRIASGYRDTAGEIVSILFVSQAICRAGVLPGG